MCLRALNVQVVGVETIRQFSKVGLAAFTSSGLTVLVLVPVTMQRAKRMVKMPHW